MNQSQRKRIESSPEIEALLDSFLKSLEADTAILYKFIDEEDIEVTELLQLLSKSAIRKQFASLTGSLIDEKSFKQNVSGTMTLDGFIEKYEDGTLFENGSVEADLAKLKKYIRVLRFCALKEKEPESTRWNFDYKRRPQKYLVFSPTILITKYKEAPIHSEGVTAYFCRVEGDDTFLAKTKDRYLKEIRECLQAAEKIPNSQYSFYNGKLERYLRMANAQLSLPEVQMDNKKKHDLNHAITEFTELKKSIEEKLASCHYESQETSSLEKNKLYWLLSRSEIDGFNAHRRGGEDPNVYNNYDSHHAGWVLLKKSMSEETRDGNPQSEEQVIGCLRFEYYVPGKIEKKDYPNRLESNFNNDFEPKFKGISVQQVIDLVINVIHNVLSKQKEKSYAEQYQCQDQLLKKLILIGMFLKKEKKINKDKRKEIELVLMGNEDEEKRDNLENELKKLEKREDDLANLSRAHYLIEHLFYVLKRNTYYGEAILQRINCFIEDLLEILGLPKQIFGNVWENLRRHEDLMLYSLDNYRDHLMHQFHNFILGYLIIYSYNITGFQGLIDLHYKKFVIIDSNQKKDSDQKYLDFIFSKTDVLRIWALTSLFHDSGYAFEKLSSGFEMFSNNVLGTKIESRFFWDKTILDSKDILVTLSRITHYFNRCNKTSTFDNNDLLGILIRKAVLDNDHGVISSILLMKQYLKHFKGFKEKKVDRIEHIMNIAAIAIALHNYPVFSNVTQQSNQNICLFLNPIAFLLEYCDSVQEWGRKKSVPESERIANPSLKLIDFPEVGRTEPDDKKLKKFVVTLDYPAAFEGLPPDTIRIKEKLGPTLSAFTTSKSYLFGIIFNIRASTTTSFPLEFYICGKECPTESECNDAIKTLSAKH